MAQKGPGKAHREGISLIKLVDMFPDEQAATDWFEARRWPEGRHCPRCGSTETVATPALKKQPYWCGACRKGFSVRIGTAMGKSKLPLRTWLFAIYLKMTSLEGVSLMKIHRDLKVTQKTAWFMLHRIREAWSNDCAPLFQGPVEVDETYIGGKRKNMPKARRRALTGCGAVGKAIVAGAKYLATNRVSARTIPNTQTATLQGFVKDHAAPGATVYTDGASGYKGMPFDHESVNHSTGEYVRGMANTQGIESFWAVLKRAYQGTYHHLSEKHLHRYVAEFAGKHNLREPDTIDIMGAVATGMVGKRLMYRDLIA